ncbi:reverse transcriptase domain-containing protein [Tanacetum coccineum]
MADNRTMAQMLQAPIEGYEDAIVVPPINANNFELKQPLINLVQSNKFTGRQDPHNHLRFFNKVTSTFRHPEVPNTSIKLLLFPFSLDGEARDWLDKEPPRSILTWDDLVSKFINQYFPPSKTTYYRNEIITFYQKPNEAFNEAWERFKGLLRQSGAISLRDASKGRRTYGRQCSHPISDRMKAARLRILNYDSTVMNLRYAQAVSHGQTFTNFGSDVIIRLSQSETYLNDMENQSVHALHDFEQSPVVDFTDNEIHNDSNIILYS